MALLNRFVHLPSNRSEVKQCSSFGEKSISHIRTNHYDCTLDLIFSNRISFYRIKIKNISRIFLNDLKNVFEKTPILLYQTFQRIYQYVIRKQIEVMLIELLAFVKSIILSMIFAMNLQQYGQVK